MKTLLIRLVLISVIAIGVVQTSGAFFSDTEKSTANTFTGGRLDLLVNGQNNPTAIVNIDDLKPGDNRIVDKTLFVDFNPANVYLHLKDLVASQGIQTEPESIEEQLNGEKSDLQNYLTYDLVVNGTPLIATADGILLPDAVSCWIPLGRIEGNTTVPVQQSFHFDPAVTNWAQGDTLTFTEEFLAQQINDTTIPDTGTGRVRDPSLKKCVPRLVTPTPTPSQGPTPTPTPIACVESWANSVSSSTQLLRKNGTAVLPDRSDPTQALIAQTTGSPSDVGVIPGTFFSTGFGGSIIVGFTNPFYNTPGADLSVYEVTGGTYPDELIDVEVSTSASGPWTMIGNDVARDVNLEMINATAQYVRITDQSNIALFEDTADAYDLDGVKALCVSGNQ